MSTPLQERFRGPTVGVLDAFFAAASAGLMLLDDHLRYVRVNEALARINNTPIEDHFGRTIDEVLYDAAELEPPLRHVLRTGEAIDRLPFELRGRSYVGTFFPVYDDGQVVRGVGGIIMDVTEHRRLERELRAAVELREGVLAIVSHDLRNPLSTIDLAMSTLPPGWAADRDVARRIEIVKRAAKLMETLIGDLLDVATLDAGKLTLRLGIEDAGAIVHEVIEQYAPHAVEKELALVEASQLAGVALRCDRARIAQVLGNLIGNSIKFCKPRDRITVGGHADRRAIVLEVSDSGPGIAAADLPHLFEPYWTTDRARQRGTGLGLYISKAIVEAHAGSLTVDSVVDVGTTFRIELQR